MRVIKITFVCHFWSVKQIVERLDGVLRFTKGYEQRKNLAFLFLKNFYIQATAYFYLVLRKVTCSLISHCTRLIFSGNVCFDNWKRWVFSTFKNFEGILRNCNYQSSRNSEKFLH